MMGVADTSLIFSMRYFLGVIADVKPIADAGYWRHFEERLSDEEGKRINSQNTTTALSSTGQAQPKILAAADWARAGVN